jgi:hypothetical protein
MDRYDQSLPRLLDTPGRTWRGLVDTSTLDHSIAKRLLGLAGVRYACTLYQDLDTLHLLARSKDQLDRSTTSPSRP